MKYILTPAEKAERVIQRLEAEVERLRTLANRLAVGLIDANRLDYPWKDGSRASKALDEAEALRDVEK